MRLAAALFLLSASLAAADPGTAFTYQGFLRNGGAPLTGTASLRFTLYDADTGGAAVGSPIERLDQSISAGTVAQSLDFGDVFDGSPRYLGVEVDLDGGSDDFTSVGSRIQLLPVPYAMHAADCDTLDGIDSAALDQSSTNELNSALSLSGTVLSLTDGGGTLTADLASLTAGLGSSLKSPDGTRPNMVATTNGGNVGINTGSPAYPFDVQANTRIKGSLVIQTDSHLGLEVYPGDEIGTSVYERFVYDEDNSNVALSAISDTKRVGVGTLSPEAALHVAGEAGVDGIKFPDGTLQTTAYTGQADGDSDSTNELVTGFSLNGQNLSLTDAGGTYVVPLTPLTAQILTSILTSPDGSPATAASMDNDGNFTVGSGELYVDVNNDRVGINTTAPGYPLEIVGTQELLMLNGSSNVGTWLRIKNTSAGGDTWRLISTGANNGEGAGKLLFSSETGGVRATIEGSTGDVGIGIANPETRLFVEGNESASDTALASYVATIHNANSGTDADGLRISVATASSNAGNNYIQFSHSATGTTFGTAAGAIQGNGAGGVSYSTSGSDFAEELPRLDPRESIQPGDVVGVFGGRVSRRTESADWVMAVSSNPAFVGSAGGANEIAVAFMGQVPVRVDGPARMGDYIVASGREDGTAIAIAPDRLDPKSAALVVGRAWEASPGAGIRMVNTAIGIPAAAQASTQAARQIEALREENRALQARLERLEQIVSE